jgi:hypothetical protein
MVVVALAWLSSCAPAIQVNSDHDRQANFSQYSSYQVALDQNAKDSNDPVLNSSLNQKRIRQAIDTEMKARGYLAGNENADLKITFSTDVQEKQEVQANNNYYGYWWWRSGNNTQIRNYEQARLVLNFIDAKTSQLVWQGWATGEVGNIKKKDRDQIIAEVVNEIMKQYPYKARQGAEETLGNKK